MGKYLATLAFALCVSAATPALGATEATREETASAPVAVQRVPALPGLRDEAAMVLVGTALIGLAAAVRRSA